MSGQQHQPRKTSPKLAPLKATMPIESVTKEGSALRDSASPDISSPSGARMRGAEGSPGPRSLGSSPPEENSNNSPCNSSNVSTIRRTASLDSIYLKGLFPRDGIFSQRDKSTQTDHSTSLDSIHRKCSAAGAAAVTTNATTFIEGKLAKLAVRQRRRSCSRESTPEQTAPSRMSPNSRSPAGTAPKSSRSSEEGLNQEIESYISRSESDPLCDRLRQPTPEGRKAPVADLYRIANFPGLTPQLVSTHISPANVNCFAQDLPLRETISPIPGHLDTPHSETEESQGSSPDQEKAGYPVVSPHINRFLARAPPDGAERVVSKPVPILKPIPVPPQPGSFFTLTPSSRSAFESLNRELDVVEERRREEKAKEEDSPLVPDQQDMA